MCGNETEYNTLYCNISAKRLGNNKKLYIVYKLQC